MKLYLKIVCIALLSISLGSCKKDSTPAPVKMGATVEGKTWDPTISGATLQNNMFVITGTTYTGEAISITISGVTTGTYSLSLLPPKVECGATYIVSAISSGDPYVSSDGTVVLTKVNTTAHTITGTFKFTVKNSGGTSKSITNGQFNDLSYL